MAQPVSVLGGQPTMTIAAEGLVVEIWVGAGTSAIFPDRSKACWARYSWRMTAKHPLTIARDPRRNEGLASDLKKRRVYELIAASLRADPPAFPPVIEVFGVISAWNRATR